MESRWNEVLLSGYGIRWRGVAAMGIVIALTIAAARIAGGSLAEAIFAIGFLALASFAFLKKRSPDDDAFLYEPDGSYLGPVWDVGWDAGGDGGGGGDG